MNLTKRFLPLFVLLMSLVTRAQQNNLIFKHLTSDDGLPSNYIGAIIQDHEGFMWFGTAEGLARYDGYTFLNIKYSPSDTVSLVHNNVRCILEDRKNNFWIGTQKGLAYFDLNTYKFRRFSSRFKENIGSSWITSMTLVNDTRLLVGTFTKGFYMYDLARDLITGYTHNPMDSNSLSHNTIRNVVCDKQNKIWLATDGGVDKFDPITGLFTHFLTGNNCQEVVLDPQGRIIASPLGNPELYAIDPQSDRIVETYKLPEITREKPKHIHFDSTGNLWIGAVDGGTFIRNVHDGTLTHLQFSRYQPNGINSNAPLVIYEDNIGNTWIGTFDSGLNLFEKNRKPFIQVKGNFLESGLLSNHIRSIYQDRDGEIWIGTKVKGMLSRFNRQTLEFVHYQPDASKEGYLNDEFVLSLTQGEPGYMWVGTLYGGLNLFDKRSGRFKAFKHDPGKPDLPMSNSIMALLRDDAGKIWVGNSEKGIDLYNPETGKFDHFVSSADTTSITDNRIRVLFQDSYRNIWIGTTNGLNLYQPATQNFKQFTGRVGESGNLSDNNIYCIFEDRFHQLWIGTSNGFNRYDYKTGTFIRFTRGNGFSANSARGIYDDRNGNLWISTDNGIVKFNPIQNDFRKYTREDGLNTNEFTTYSSWRTKNGEIYFGTENGFVVFDPEKVSDNLITPPVVITDFRLFNQNVPIGEKNSPLQQTISRSKAITLNYRQSVMTFDFAALNYTSPEKNQYAYQMEGFDNGWNNVGTRRNATYTNLPSGTYTFRVKASNNDGIWNDKGTMLSITILPPPWRTVWAYLIYALLLIIIILKFRDITVKRIHEEKERELDQMKLRFFVNISHEFRTPLTLMLNPIEKLQVSEEVSEMHDAAVVVKRSAWKLLNLVNQLLDFRKIDMGKSALEARETEVIGFTRNLCGQYVDLARNKNIQLSFASRIENLPLWIDRDKWDKILTNLLSNALKFTNPGGLIEVTLDTVTCMEEKKRFGLFTDRRTTEYAELRVSDTGIGLSADEIHSIFERFYQVDHTKPGTGIGLNYVKGLTELHGGEVLIESDPGKGSTFIIRIPTGNKHLEPEELASDGSLTEPFSMDTGVRESLLYDLENTDNYRESAGEVTISRLNKLLILVVEDNKTLRKQIVSEFSTAYIVKEAANGSDGLEKTKKYLPDLIISDIMMPIMDGITMCRSIKSDLNICHIPVLLLTAKGSIENQIEGFQTGADEYLSKPFSMPLLWVRVDNLIHSRKVLKDKYTAIKTLVPASEFTTNNLDEAFLEKATRVVLENIEDSDFSMKELRERMGMGQTNLFTKLQSITGQNPSQFVRTVRLKYAAGLLLQGNLSVKDVCYQSGFSSPAYFAKTFRELLGQSPTEYIESQTGKRV